MSEVKKFKQYLNENTNGQETKVDYNAYIQNKSKVEALFNNKMLTDDSEKLQVAYKRIIDNAGGGKQLLNALFSLKKLELRQKNLKLEEQEIIDNIKVKLEELKKMENALK